MFRQNSSEVPFGPSNHWLSATANSLWEGFVPTFPRLRFSTLTTIAPHGRRITTLFRYAKFFAKASQYYVKDRQNLRRPLLMLECIRQPESKTHWRRRGSKMKKPVWLSSPENQTGLFPAPMMCRSARRRFYNPSRIMRKLTLLSNRVHASTF